MKLHMGLGVLSLAIFLFIAYTIKNRPMTFQEAQKGGPPPRQSITLVDDGGTYHLNITQYLMELPFMQNYRCTPLLSPPGEPEHDHPVPVLVMAIKSHPDSFSRREAARKTWAREWLIDSYKTKPIFLIAQGDRPETLEKVKKESEEFNDVLMWDFLEGHYNLSLKEMCFLEWLQLNIPHVDFVFKGDDDNYVNPWGLVQYIRKHGSPYKIHGALQNHSAVQRGGKYGVSISLFSMWIYPKFLSGSGFLYPGHTVKHLYRASQKLPVFPLDDVYFGMLATAINLTFHHDKRFHVWGLAFEPCSFQRAFIVHGISPQDLPSIWQKVQEATCNNTQPEKD
ncbi:beta-1,3-galactosyltransferase 5-like [Gastrophryne carolinensis]